MISLIIALLLNLTSTGNLSNQSQVVQSQKAQTVETNQSVSYGGSGTWEGGDNK